MSTLTEQENNTLAVRDCINNLNCEWQASYDYPGFLGVYPKRATAVSDDGVNWCFGIDQGVWHGNDRTGDNSASLLADTDPHNLAPLREDAHPYHVAARVIAHMRHYALKRIEWLNEFAEKCVAHIEQASATSQPLVNTWRQR